MLKIATLAVLSTVPALVRDSDGAFQILNNVSECLTLSATNTYLAHNPALNLQDFYSSAVFEACDVSNERQWFAHNADSQLEADSLCLTPLPVDSTSHPGLDYCDTWSGFSGVGSYLFSMPCDNTNVAQSFNYLASDAGTGLSSIYQSGCAHALFLGAAGSRGILTGTTNTFPTAGIIDQITITPDLTISQPAQPAAYDILDSLLDDAQLTEVLGHGCFCSRYDLGYTDSTSFGPAPVDELDRICKHWAQMRRCNRITGGSCNGVSVVGQNYTIAQSVDINGDIDFSCNNNDQCKDDSCVIDMTFALQVLNYLTNNPGFTADQQLPTDCMINSVPGALQERICSGTAPNLEFQVVII